MTIAELRSLLHRHRPGNHRDTDPRGFGYSRDTTTPDPAVVPDGVELHFFTGRTRQEATR